MGFVHSDGAIRRPSRSQDGANASRVAGMAVEVAFRRGGSMRNVIFVIIFAGLAAVPGEVRAGPCSPQSCSNSCPAPNPWRWCQTDQYEDCTGDGCIWRTYTPVTYQNHSSIATSLIDASAGNWNYPGFYA